MDNNNSIGDDNLSPTLKCQTILAERKLQGLEVYDFGLGANPIPQPSVYINALKKYAHRKEYTSCEGIAPLNNIIKNMYKKTTIERFTDFNYDVLVGNGLKELIFILQYAFKGKIFHINPSWVSYREHIKIMNREKDLVEINTSLSSGYNINPRDLDSSFEKYKEHPKIIILNSPNNPLGTYITRTQLETLANIFRKHNCIVISDEIYLNLAFDGECHSISEFIPDLTIRCTSVSKDMGCGGYRIGWAAFPQTLRDFYIQCKMFSSCIYSCAPTPLQYATYEMLQDTVSFKRHCKMSVHVYRTIVEHVCNVLRDSNITFVRPNASWYVFLNFDYYKNKLSENGIFDSNSLCLYLIKTIGFICVSGNAFNVDGLNIRISLVDFSVDIDEKSGIVNFDYTRITIGLRKLIILLNTL